MNVGKKLLFALLGFWICGLGLAKAQIIFHLQYDSLNFPTPDSGSYGDTIHYDFEIQNTGPVAFSDSSIDINIRTSQGTFLLGSLGQTTIPAFGSVPVSLEDTLSFGRYGGGGVSIIVIWPTAATPMPTDSIKDTIYITSVGIEDGNPEDFGLQIFPNPTSNQLYFHTKHGYPIREMVLLNAAGQVIFKHEGLPSYLSLEEYPAGIYFLTVEAQSGAKATFRICRR